MLFLIYLFFPMLEIYLLFQASKHFGFFNVLILVIVSAWVGSRLVKSQGLIVLSEFQAKMGAGQLPKKEVIEGLMVLFAGVLLIAPGFITDAFGILCLIPMTRKIISHFVARWVEGKIRSGQIHVYSNMNFGGPFNRGRVSSEIRDVTPTEKEPKELD